jgi:hypothetical protein
MHGGLGLRNWGIIIGKRRGRFLEMKTWGYKKGVDEEVVYC